MYLSNSKNVFVQFQKCICPIPKMYLSNFKNVFVQFQKCICPISKMYLSNSKNVFVQFQKCICPIPKMYLCMQVTPTCDPAKPGSPNDVTRPHRHQTLQPAVQQVLQEYLCQWWTNSIQRPKSVPKQVYALTR